MLWLAIALAKIAAGVLAWIGALAAGDLPPTPLPAALHAALLVTFAASGLALVAGSRRGGPARSLGTVFCLFASIFADASLRPHAGGGFWAGPSELLLAMSPAALAPYYLWQFAWAFPRVQPALVPAWVPRLLERLTLWTGTVLFAATLVLALLGDERQWTARNLMWTSAVILELPSVLLLIVKTRTALPDERRRATLFVAGLVVGMAPLLIDVLLSALIPPYAEFMAAPQRNRVAGSAVAGAILLLPFITAYAVVVDRALETKFIVRLAIQYMLARYTVLALLTVPLALFLGYLYVHRHEPLVEILTQASPRVWLVLLALALGMAAVRKPVLRAIDRRYYRDHHDAHRVLANLTDSSRRVASLEGLATLVTAEIDKALHPREAALLVQRGAAFEDPLGRMPPLAADSTLARLLSGSAAAFDVDLSNRASPLHRLPATEIGWLSGTHPSMLVPLIAPGGGLEGLLVLGEKRSETRYAVEDRFLLQAVAGSAVLALEQQRRLNTPPRTPRGAGDDALDSEPARECDRCRRVFDPSAKTCPACAAALRPAAVPVVVAGKFRVVERLGSGGMGVVYRAEDLLLRRAVAIKTLPHLSDAAARRLRREAQALATLQHANLEGIYGVESWRDMPMVVLEYLAGGTLLHRMERGPLDIDPTIAVGSAMADALHSLHRVGVLHRDIKPSNIGFTADGSPKLLDFGLAIIATAEHDDVEPAETSPAGDETTHTGARLRYGASATSGIAAGTPLYMSPEAIAGGTPDVSFDLWGLAVTLYEALAGRNPFVARDRLETARLITSVRVPDIRALREDCPEALALFLRDALSLNAAARPRSAREFQSRLRAVRVAA
jgi:hypothetical protein